MNKECPFCQSKEIIKIYKRHNFNVPNPFSSEIGVLTIRFPFFKCESCQEEFGAIETQNTIQSAVEEYVKKCFDQHQKIKKEENAKLYDEQMKIEQIIKTEINKNKKTFEKLYNSDAEINRKIWFSTGILIGLGSIGIWPLMQCNIILGSILIFAIVLLSIIGFLIKNNITLE